VPLKWQRKAFCRNLPHQWFFPEGTSEAAEAERKAKTVCRACPVLLDCRHWARSEQVEFGIWGGETSRERLASSRSGRQTA
jgi:WhiB family transcriptional regulator, redox-sensing transcriptional regulator